LRAELSALGVLHEESYRGPPDRAGELERETGYPVRGRIPGDGLLFVFVQRETDATAPERRPIAIFRVALAVVAVLVRHARDRSHHARLRGVRERARLDVVVERVEVGECEERIVDEFPVGDAVFEDEEVACEPERG